MTPKKFVLSALTSVAWGFLLTSLWLSLIAIGSSLVVGWDPKVVVGDSMAPAIRIGHVILTSDDSAVIDRSEGNLLMPGSIITFDHGAGPITHRIIEIKDNLTTGGPEYITQGDANVTPDSTPVSPEEVDGVVRMVIPLIGLPQAWLAAGKILHVAGLAVLYILALTLVIIEPPAPQRTKPKGRRKKTKEDLLVS